MSKTIAGMIGRFAGLATSCMKPKRRAVALALASERLQQVRTVPTARGDLAFCSPTARALLDPLNFPGDEPETVAWIDDFIADGEVMWDIGANIGLYALYAALGPGIRVLAFRARRRELRRADAKRRVERHGRSHRRLLPGLR